MNEYTVAREFLSWEYVTIEANSEAEALRNVKMNPYQHYWEYVDESNLTGKWHVLQID